MYSNFHSNFNRAIQNNDFEQANDALMAELADILVRDRKDFVDLLNESEIPADITMSDTQLIDLFIDNIENNKTLMLGAALLTQMHNRKMGFDGDEEIDDDGVKTGYTVLNTYFSDLSNFDSVPDVDCDCEGEETCSVCNDEEQDEEHSQVWGALIGGLAKGVGNLIGGRRDNAEQGGRSRSKRRRRPSGPSAAERRRREEAAAREREAARQRMIQAALLKRKQEAERKRKELEEKKRKKTSNCMDSWRFSCWSRYYCRDCNYIAQT
jgi:hypothetical protein